MFSTQLAVRSVKSPFGRLFSRGSVDFGERHHWAAISLFLLCCLVPLIGHAQIVSTHIAYDEKLKRSRAFGAIDENLFGDKVNLQDGSVSFSQDDVVLATNSQLQVSIGRKTPSSSQGLDVAFAVFGRDWELNIPYMMGTFDDREGWKSASGTRCSTANFAPREWAGPWPNFYTQIIYAYMYWHGININIPGHGEELLLQKNATQVLPTDGKAYYGTTRSSWRVSCLPSSAQAGGEGFAVTLPDGTTYYFDWKAGRNAVDLSDGTEQQMDLQDPWHLLAPLTDVFLYATKVVDRFGNSLTYSYDAAHPNRLTAITSNDGVRLDVQYNATGQISAVTSAGRTWVYTYVPDTNSLFSRLQSITLPDASRWLFTLQKPTAGPLGLWNFWSDACKADPKDMKSELPPDPSTVEIVTMTHPSGAKGEFWFRKLYNGTNNTPGGCTAFGSMTDIWYGTYGVPSAYVSNSIYQKKISGPAIPERTWSYMYYPSWTFASQCSGGCSATSQTTVQTDDLVLRRYTFGNSYSSNLGQLLSESTEQGGVVKQTKTYSYIRSAVGQSFADNAGDISRASGNIDSYGNPFKFLNRPMQSAVTKLDGVTMTQSISSFDVFVRPLSVLKSSSLGYSKTEATEYQDDRFRWVLGLLKRSTTDGIESGRTDYDAMDLPWRTYAFGLLQETLSYAADGTLATVTDGRNLTTTVSLWKRGTPQKLAYPTVPVVTQRAQVNDSGNLGWVENELGVQTSYGYDAMDRLSSITYPTGDTTAWNATTLPIVSVAVVEYGIPAGHWKRTDATGNGKTTTFYNALWQPVLALTEDTGIAASKSFVVSRYDSAGRLAFTSYPVASLVSINDVLQGSSMEYDALGRMTKLKQDSELAGALAVLTSTTEYLSGFQTRETNPRGYQTTTRYQVFDAPDTSRPVLIQAPEGVTTTITRDVFGKPLTVTRSGPAG